jgi:hypothetical protein
MSTSLVDRLAGALAPTVPRRSFLARAALAGSAVVVTRGSYLWRRGDAHAAVCDCKGLACGCGSPCCDGWSEFCCTLTGSNACPPGTTPAGWWKVDSSSFCNGGARYYIDCNNDCGGCGCGASGLCGRDCDGAGCGCAGGDCANWAASCNRFRYGQCHQDACVGSILCRVVTCTPPWLVDATCTTTAATSNATAGHHRPCAEQDGAGGEARSLETDPGSSGYWVVDAVGGVSTFGGARYYGSVAQLRVEGRITSAPVVVDFAPTPEGDGYWLADDTGGVFAFGRARFFGSIPQLRLQGRVTSLPRVVAIAPTPEGDGYWLADDTGGVFAFGRARFFGSIPQLRLQGRVTSTAVVVDLSVSPGGDGYRLVDAGGIVYPFGNTTSPAS